MHEVIGPYSVHEILGKGGMGVVYRGQHADTGVDVAIKVVAHAASRVVAGIRRELHALERVHHPSVVRILDQGTLDGLPWYAMELLHGQTLRQLHSEHWGRSSSLPTVCDELAKTIVGGGGDVAPRLPPPPLVPPPAVPTHLIELVAAVCEPLAVLHAAGIVHRDLKPENIIVTGDRGPVLVDFGIAMGFAGSAGREELAATGEVLGTPEYMAPEQIRGELVDARADLYALGCILYECLLGRPPFIGWSASEILAQHLHAAPQAPSLWGVVTGRELEALLFRLLAKRAADRIGFAEDVAATLRGLGYGGATHARAPVEPYLYRSELTGRDDVMARAQAALDELQQQRHGEAIFVVGESGVGKTRLGMEIAQRAVQRAMTVVTGQCGALVGKEAPPLHPFAPLVGEIIDRCRAGGDEVRTKLLGPWIRVLAPYFPELRALADLSRSPDPVPLNPDAARARVLDAATTMAWSLASVAPLILVIDDLQWADELSLAVLGRFAPATLAEHGILLIALCRAEDVSEPLESLARTLGATRWDLGRLDASGVAAMAAGMLAMRNVPRVWVEVLGRVSAGNPFFLAEYLRAAIGAGLLARDADGRWSLRAGDAARSETLGLPTAIEALIAHRIEGLGSDERRLLGAAAVLGRSFVGELAAEVSGLEARAALDAVTVLKRRQILEESAQAQLRFVHDRIREVAYSGLPGDERRELHGRAAQRIEALHPDDAAHHASLAHHHAGAGQPAAACRYFILAAQRAEAAYANEQAIELYRAAVHEATTAGGDSADLSTAIWTRLGELRQRTGDPAGARDDYAQALRHAGPAPSLVRANLHRRQGNTWETVQGHKEALAAYTLAERCLEEMPRHGSERSADWWHEWVQTQIDRISIHYWAGDLFALGMAVEGLAPVVEEYGSAAQRARFFLSLVQRNVRQECYRTSAATVEHARRSLAAFAQTSSREDVATARFTLAAVLLWQDDLVEAEAHMLGALDEAEQIGSMTLQARCLAYLTVICRRRRDCDATRGMAWRCQSVAQAAHMVEYLGTAEANLGWVHLQEGRRDAGEELCRAALARWHGRALAHPFEWLARLPLLTLADRNPPDQLAAHLHALLAPSQQRLPESLEQALMRARDAPGDAALLAAALHVAEALGFV